MNEVVRTTPTAVGGSALIPRDMASAMALANMMATGKLVPAHLQRSPGDCLMVIEQAMRWGMSPFAVAQCTSVIQGRLMFEGKLVSAALHASGIMSGRLEYTFTGTGDARTISVSGTLRGEDTPRVISVTLKEAKTTNGMWVKQPDQQLVYFATRVWVRRHASEVMLGVYSPEEFDATAVAAPPQDTFRGTTIDAGPEQQPEPPPKKRTLADVINELEAEFTAATTRGAVDAVLASTKCQNAMDYARNGAKERLDGIVKAALDKTAAVENDPTVETEEEYL